MICFKSAGALRCSFSMPPKHRPRADALESFTAVSALDFKTVQVCVFSESSSALALEPDDLSVDAALLAAESNLLIVTLDKLLNEPMMMMSFFVLAGTKIGAELHKYGARTI